MARVTLLQAVRALEHTPSSILTCPSVVIVYLVSNYTRIHPNTITVLGTACGLAGSLLVLAEQWLAAGICYYLFFLLDACDGRIARFTKQTSEFGMFLDFQCDRFVTIFSFWTHFHYFAMHSMGLEITLAAGFAMFSYYYDVLGMFQPPPRETAAVPAGEKLHHRTLLWKILSFSEWLWDWIRPKHFFSNMIFFSAANLFPTWRVRLYAVCCAIMAVNFLTDYFRPWLVSQIRRRVWHLA